MVNIVNSAKSGITPIISVCIANYNGTEYLHACLESILQQTLSDIPVEVIIHDDASTDDSVTIIETEYGFVNLIKSSNNVGYCMSNNRMVAAARGKYILLLNNDAMLEENALAKLYGFAEGNNDDYILSLPQINLATGEHVDFGMRLDIFLNPVPILNQQYDTDIAMVIGACLWVPKHVWLKTGGFPEWFGSCWLPHVLWPGQRPNPGSVR